MRRRQIIPLDGSEAAEAALAYAEAIPADDVRLLLCLQRGSNLPDRIDPGSTSEAGDPNRAAAEAYLDRQAVRFTALGRGTQSLVLDGDPAERIIEIATPDDLILMTTHGRGAGTRAIFGSVADRVVRHAASPVFLVRGGSRPIETAPLRRIVAGLDGSERAERVLTEVTWLARELDLPIHLVRVLDLRGVEEAIKAGTYAALRFAASGGEIREAFVQYLTEQSTALASEGLRVTFEVLDGAPAERIAGAAVPGDVIAITSHGRGGLSRWMLGSVADKLVRTAPVPVLLCR